MSTLNALKIRRRLGINHWATPVEFGPDGWLYDNTTITGRILVTVANWDGIEWIHASMSWAGETPDYQDLKWLHQAVFEDRYAFQVFAPPGDHINIHDHTLHLWGRLDGTNPLPEFGKFGSI